MKKPDYNIERFYYEHKRDYEVALKEVKNGRKYSHWIWYVFPQLKVLGRSEKAVYYGIENTEEAKEYYDDEYLGERFREICRALLHCGSDNSLDIFGYIDNLKVCSSMTLFYAATGDELFKKVIDKFYDGNQDEITLNFLGIKCGNRKINF